MKLKQYVVIQKGKKKKKNEKQIASWQPWRIAL